MSSDILIDCYGKSFVDEIRVSHQGRDYCFIFSPEKKAGRAFSLALYLDNAALAKDVAKYPHQRRICLMLESPISMVFEHAEQLRPLFRKTYTLRKTLIESGEPYGLLYYGTSWLEGAWEGQQFDKTSLVSFLGSIDHNAAHGYSLRMDVARICMGLAQVDCYGKGINPIDSKLDGLGKYAFSIAMENVQEDFYFSEKLIDCLLTDTVVPIYWGCPAITELFDKRGMILFSSLDELADILRGLSMERYRELPFVRKNRDIAIKHEWHTLTGIYTRLTESLVKDMPLDDLPPVKPRGRVHSSIRRLLHMS